MISYKNVSTNGKILINFIKNLNMGLFSFFFKNNTQKIKAFLEQNAVILDVRTKQEWNEGHIANAMHIPLSDLKNHVEEIKKLNKPVIVHCKSGARSARATKLLKFYKIEAVNGGGLADLKLLIA
ncbi:sulfur carrier protein adenylyltransferase ThiF [Jejuia pallidilutea]|uniref:Sulfur carrier protein adenylyltransferase ThiF n=2 Tax=Jejuia pallidilutea TaxID=504487 RepID=A0A090WMS9_9FLAO|nr:sulfur carrier protein adenylyltransferase ThiF [Jejuia pallidilutea]GAL73205.1 sulfur carrier protein adenylyltransferase ThiF [Jejuia pallidilutea]